MLASVLLDLASTLPSPSPTAAASAASSGQSGFFDAGIGRFPVSPGLGGVAAFLGGLLAYLAANRKSKDDREKAERDRWWETLTWVYDRGTATDQAGMPADMAIAMLDQLFVEAQDRHTDREIAAIAASFAVFETRQQAEQKKSRRRPGGRS